MGGSGWQPAQVLQLYIAFRSHFPEANKTAF